MRVGWLKGWFRSQEISGEDIETRVVVRLKATVVSRFSLLVSRLALSVPFSAAKYHLRGQ